MSCLYWLVIMGVCGCPRLFAAGQEAPHDAHVHQSDDLLVEESQNTETWYPSSSYLAHLALLNKRKVDPDSMPVPTSENLDPDRALRKSLGDKVKIAQGNPQQAKQQTQQVKFRGAYFNSYGGRPVAGYGGLGGYAIGGYGAVAGYGRPGGYGVLADDRDLLFIVTLERTKCNGTIAGTGELTAILRFSRTKLCQEKVLQRIDCCSPQTLSQAGTLPNVDEFQIIVTLVEFRGNNVVTFILALSTKGLFAGRFLAIRVTFSVGQLLRFCGEPYGAHLTSDDVVVTLNELSTTTAINCRVNPQTCSDVIGANNLVRCTARAFAS